MKEDKVDLLELDWKFRQLQQHAEAIETGLHSLDDSDFREVLSADEGGSAYCSILYEKLQRFYPDFWKLRLAVVWELFPARREGALGFCRAQFAQISKLLVNERLQDPQWVLTSAFQTLGKAGVLLNELASITTADFAEGTAALAETLCWYSPWEDSIGGWEIITDFYQHLYHAFVPQEALDAC